MARRTRNQPAAEAGAEGTEAQAGEAAAAPRTRRARQTQKSGTIRGRSAGQQNETGRLIEALLKNRSSRGATQQDLEQLVSWAEGIRAEAAAIEAEAAELRKLGPRGARSKTGAAAARQKQQREARQRELEERRRKSEMNQALLAGVLTGTVFPDVQGGKILFVHQEFQGAHAVRVVTDTSAQAA